ncbi:H-NS family nucleoid-associated regulatory protein [Roseateles sp. BYS78W]|uniref:H-NS family nucleoid-associated regulatory protein n=1 Tax=Pelomonas candidula TaxID=3299025 RepID=A0ABW7HL21_9BURK
MAKSLSKIMGQIEKLQKEAAAIQSTVIARIRREIAQHGLTAEQLFSSTDGAYVGNGRTAPAKAAPAKSKGAAKPPKYADDKGNTWHGVGKRPNWIHAALDAGHSLDEFLVGSKKAGSAAASEAPASVAVGRKPRAIAKAAKKPTAAKKSAAVKKSAAAKTAVAKRAPAKKVGPAKKATKAAGAAKPARKAPTKTAVKAGTAAKKAVAKKSAPPKPATAEAVAEQASS